MYSDSNIRILQVDIAKLKVDGVLTAEDARDFDDVIWIDLVHEPEKIERAIELRNKYKNLPAKKAKE